jgi:4-hydroxy-tetrahydrodipicolinate reductase
MSVKIAKIAMAGLPGKMSASIAELALESNDIELAPFALTGPGVALEQDIGNKKITLISIENKETFFKEIENAKVDIIIDFSHPNAVSGNVTEYTQRKLPFILGTTGGDYKKVETQVIESETPAIIAPNMALPIVALTAMFEMCSAEFPGVFSKYDLSVGETHQKGKADTSGTAKALIALLQKSGAKFSENDLSLCRDPDIQKKKWGIPEEHLTGHAFHTYDLFNSDKSAHFSFSHNVLGRKIYSEGTLDAVRFLAPRIDDKVTRSYNMIDVLKNL